MFSSSSSDALPRCSDLRCWLCHPRQPYYFPTLLTNNTSTQTWPTAPRDDKP